MEKLLRDERLFKLLEKADWDIAQEAHEGVCKYCGAKLDWGDFERKPRGGGRWKKRHSFCCKRCRKRHTPPSVRFLGRRVYVGVVVVLVAAMMQGVTAKRVERLRQELGIDERTLKRWRKWWLEDFVESGFWHGERGRFMPGVDEMIIPLCLVKRFGARSREGMVRLLKCLSPITVHGGLEGLAM